MAGEKLEAGQAMLIGRINDTPYLHARGLCIRTQDEPEHRLIVVKWSARTGSIGKVPRAYRLRIGANRIEACMQVGSWKK